MLILSLVKKRFRFEKWWLNLDSFAKLVEKAWSTPCTATKSIDIWQFKMGTLRRLVRGWAMNEVAKLNKTKVELALEHYHLDMERENRDLTSSQLERLHIVETELDNLGSGRN